MSMVLYTAVFRSVANLLALVIYFILFFFVAGGGGGERGGVPRCPT